MSKPTLGRGLAICATGIGLMAVSNALKPLQMGGEHTGFVLFGLRLAAPANLWVGPVVGVYQAVLATSIVDLRRRALWMSRLYAGYVFLNLILFPFRSPNPPTQLKLVGFILIYAPVALGIAGGAAYLLGRRQQDLT